MVDESRGKLFGRCIGEGGEVRGEEVSELEVSAALVTKK